MRSIIFLTVLLVPFAAISQVFMRPFDNATTIALGSATIAYPGLGAGLNNDGAPAFDGKAGVFLSSALPFGISGWQTAQFQAYLSAGSKDGFGLEILHSAIEVYGEQKFRLVYGRRLSPKILLGGSASLLRASAQEYGNATGASFSLSILANPLPDVWIGARVQNPVRMEISGAAIPSVLRIGAAWQAASTLILLLETEKDVERPAQVKAGVEYFPVNQVAIRLGVRSNPARLGFGAGYRLKNGLEISPAAEWHPTLGFTPAAMIVWRK